MPRIKELVDKIDEYKKCLELKKAEAIIHKFEEGVNKYLEWKNYNLQLQKLREELNKLSKEYYKTKNDILIEESKNIKTEIRLLEEKVKILEEEIAKIELILPNWISEDVPIGCGEEYEKPIRYIGRPKVWEKYQQEFEKLNPRVEYDIISYEPFHHYNLMGKFINQEKAGKIAMSRFYYEFDEIVILDFAITMYALEFFRNKGYGDKLMITPYLMRRSVEEKITYFESFVDTIFEIEKEKLILIPTSEHSIVAYYEDTIFHQGDLPIRIIAWSPAFRKEAGAHGKDTRGIFRVRQFHKVEVHSILKKGEDFKEMERITKDVQDFLISLGLPNRAVVVPGGDMDKRALKQVDP